MFVHDGLLVGAPLLGAGVLVYPDSGPPITWSVDATSGKGVPADATEWGDMIAAKGLANWAPPTSLYLCQEAASPIVDQIGSFDLAAFGSGQSYQQAVSGWSRSALALTDGASGRGWRSLDAGLPDLSTTSCLLLAFIAHPSSAPAAERVEVQLGGSSTSIVILQTSGVLRTASGGNSVAGSANVTGTVTPCVVRVNRADNTIHGFTDSDEMGPTTVVTTGKAMYLGSAFNAPTAKYLYAARWDGSAAERSDADVKALLEALGWTVTGY